MCPLCLPGYFKAMSQDHFTQASWYAGFLFLLLVWSCGPCLIHIVTNVNLSDKAQELTRPSVSYPCFRKSSFLGINPEDVNVEIMLYKLLLKGSLSEIWTMQSNCVNLPSGKWKQFSRVESTDWLFKFRLYFSGNSSVLNSCIEIRFFNAVRLCNCFNIFCILYCNLMQKSKCFNCHVLTCN